MKKKSRQLDPVNLDSGQHRHLAKIIENLRKDVVIPNNRSGGASMESTDEAPESSTAERNRFFRGRAGAFHRGLSGVAQRIPA